MHRFFIEQEDHVASDRIWLRNPETCAHLTKVLRVRIGESLEIVTPDKLIVAEVSALDGDGVEAIIRSEAPHTNESKVKIDLFQCLPKGQKLELILQKNVELGVNAFHLVKSKRCIVDYKDKDIPKKLDRLNKIIKEASKQSKRDVIPSLDGIFTTKEVLNQIENYDLFLVLYEREDAKGLKARINGLKEGKVAILVGPEGGLEAEEVDAFVARGALSTTLGKRILRTETAGFVAVSCIGYESDALG